MHKEEHPLLEQFNQALQKEDRTAYLQKEERPAYDAQVASYWESDEKAHAKEVEEKKRPPIKRSLKRDSSNGAPRLAPSKKILEA